MSHGLKLLLIAAGAIITCIVVVVGFQLTKSGKSDTNKASEQYTKVMGEFDDISLTMYEDMEVSGSEVVSFIKDNAFAVTSNQINGITVSTSASGTQSYVYSSYAKKTADDLKNQVNLNQKVTTANNYINPTGTFACSIVRNSNGMVTDIQFVQK